MAYLLTKQSILLACAIAIGACSVASSTASDQEKLARETKRPSASLLASADFTVPPEFGPIDEFGRHSSSVWLGDRMAVEDWVYEETSLGPEDRVTQEAYARFLEALLEAEKGDLEQAMASLELARKARPEDKDILLAKAMLYLRDGDSDKAIETAGKALAEDPGSLEAILILAEAHLGKSRGSGKDESIEAAIQYFEAARKLSPHNLRVLIPLGQVYWDRFHRSSTPEMRKERGQAVIGVYKDGAEATNGRSKRVPYLVLASLHEITGQRETAETFFEKAIEADRGYTASYIQAGDFYLRSQNNDKALKTYRRALIVHPNDSQVQQKIDQLLRSETGDELLDFYSNLVDEFRLNPDYPKLYAERLVGYGKLEEAAEAYKVAAERDMQDFDVRVSLVKLLVELERGIEAVKYLRQAEGSGERTPKFLADLSELYSASGQDDDAERLLREAAEISPEKEKISYLTRLSALLADSGDIEGAIEVVEQAKALRPEDARSYLLLSWFYKDKDRVEEALEALNEGLLNVPEDRRSEIQGQRVVLLDDLNRPLEKIEALNDMRALTKNPSDIRDIDLLRAEAMIETGSHDRAEDILLEIKDSDKSSELQRRKAWIQLSGLYEEKGEIERSLAAMDETRYGARGEALIYIERRRAQLLADLGKYDQAEELLLATLENTGQSPLSARLIRFSLADMYSVTNQFRKAENIYLSMIEEDPVDAAARLHLGMVYDRQRRDDEAEAQYRKVMELDPGNAEAYNTLGYMFAVRGINLVEARQLIERALELSPGAAHIVDSLGWVYYQMGNIDDAIVQLETAANEIPDPEVLEHLGDAYLEAGRIDEAKATYQTALEAEPDREGISAKIQALDKPRQ